MTKLKNIIIVTGSARPNSSGKYIAELTRDLLDSYPDTKARIIEIKDLDLPFLDSELAPADDNYSPTNKNVKSWTEMVDSADGVVFVTPEYNTSLSAIQKNAIDWIYKEWNDKPVALVGYGWHKASRVHLSARAVLENVKANIMSNTTGLMFTQDLAIDGKILDLEEVTTKLKATLDELIANLNN